MNETRGIAVDGSRLLRAAAIYFVAVFAVGLLLRPVRVLWLEPWLGQTIAVLIEAPFLIGAMAVGARLARAWAQPRGGCGVHLGIGVIALAMQQIADLAVGFGLRGMTLADQLAYFATPAGMIYAATLAIFALVPFVTYWRARRTQASE